MSNSSRSEDSQVLFSTFRRNPFSLKFDWVARRLFWVEDGDTVSLYNTLVLWLDYYTGIFFIGSWAKAHNFWKFGESFTDTRSFC